MRVVMVGRDVAPSRALDLVKKELLTRDVTVFSGLGHGKPLEPISEEALADMVSTSDLVFLGMSCSPDLAKEELIAAKAAAEAGVLYGFYADLFGTSNRRWFESVREKAGFVFVLSEEEARKTKPLFSNAEVVASGSPIMEESFFGVTRSILSVRDLLGMEFGDCMIYCTAGKDRETNRANFKIIAEAISLLPDRHRWKLFFFLHPGDQNDPSIYNDVVQADGVHARFLPAKETKAMNLLSLDAIGACDLMVASVSTSGIEAACLRKPVIDNLPPLSVARMKEQTGSDVWPPCEFGISRPVMGDPAELARAIQDLMSPGGFDEMRARQEACFPMPKERGAAVRIMTDTIMRIIS